jgi:hypothetical protein
MRIVTLAIARDPSTGGLARVGELERLRRRAYGAPRPRKERQ